MPTAVATATATNVAAAATAAPIAPVDEARPRRGSIVDGADQQGVADALRHDGVAFRRPCYTTGGWGMLALSVTRHRAFDSQRADYQVLLEDDLELLQAAALDAHEESLRAQEQRAQERLQRAEERLHALDLELAQRISESQET